jgi:GR25 family glycosyltransferase involved in LPS biosynthesis
MHIYVIHYTPLKERKQHIIDEFARHNITDYEFIESFDKEALTESDKTKFTEQLNEGQKSIISKHLEAYRKIATGYDAYSLIFEDDVVLSDNFNQILQSYMSQFLPQNGDMLFISDCAELHMHKGLLKSNSNIYKKTLLPTFWGGAGGSRGTDAYIVSATCARRILHYVQTLTYKINTASDHWLNQVMMDLSLKVFWAEPTLVTQLKLERSY